jgi:hypothetical protein
MESARQDSKAALSRRTKSWSLAADSKARRQAASIGRIEPAELLEVAAGRQQEHAAVPEIVAALDKGFRARGVGLLHEFRDRTRRPVAAGLPDVPVARLGARRYDAERHEAPFPSGRDRLRYGAAKCREICEHVVGRQHKEERLFRGLAIACGVRECRERGYRDRRRGVAARRLEQDRGRCEAGLAQLLRDQEAVRLVADDERSCHPRQAGGPERRLLDHRPLSDERQELLRVELPRQRPEPRPRAARQDDRNQHGSALEATLRLEVADHLVDALRHRELRAVDDDLGCLRGLIGRGHAGEVLILPSRALA